MQKYKKIIDSPVGLLGIEVSDYGLEQLTFEPEKLTGIAKEHKLISKVEKQLNEYFVGKRKQFDIKLNLKGTEFQINVWNELLKIPFGEAISYQEVAIRIKNSKAVRAVGLANNKNNIAIIIPCHRVIGKNNKLVGYASGIENKKWLLIHEGLLIEDDKLKCGCKKK